VVGPDGGRLAKRHGAVTLADLAARGRTPAQVLALLGESLGLPPVVGVGRQPGVAALLDAWVEGFDLAALPRAPWVVDPAAW
jgi:glutamyl-tRNA synthetase